MAPVGSDGQTDWLPGLGSRSPRPFVSYRSNLQTTDLNTQAMMDPKADQVQYSIVCDDCGIRFWSCSKANAHARLTAHVLREGYSTLGFSITVPESPGACSESSLETRTLPTSARGAEASPKIKTLNQEDGEDFGDEVRFDRGSHFWSTEAARRQTRTEHEQDKESLASNFVDESPPTMGPVANATSPTTTSGVHPNAVYWSTKPGYDHLVASRTSPTFPVWINEQLNGPAVPPTFISDNAHVNPTARFGVASPTSSHVTDSIETVGILPTVPDNEFEGSHPERDGNLRRSPGVSPSPAASELLSAQHLPRYVNTGNHTVLTPTTSDSPSPNSSRATLEHPVVVFPPELSNRIFFIVTPSRNRKGPGFIMGLAEAQNAETFRTGVRYRLESQGEQVGFRMIVARIPWLSVPVYANSDEDHHHMLVMIKSWPEWQKSNWNACCQIFLTLEEDKGNKGEGERQ